MNRRHYLSATGAAVSVGLAGCLDSVLPGNEENSFESNVRILDHDLMVYPLEDGNMHFVDVVGDAINISDRTLSTVVLMVDVFDVDDQYLTYETKSYTNIEARTEWVFEIPILMPEGVDFADEIDDYEFSIHEDMSTVDDDHPYAYR